MTTTRTASPARTVRWGVIGTGAIAKTFARSLPASDTGDLAAVASRSDASAQKFLADLDVDAAAHGSYAALLADANVDAVYIATPHPMHAEWAIRAAEAGKHVLCEKPVGVNHAEAMAIIEAAVANNVFLMEAFMYRCHPQTARVLELIREGAIGDVRVIQATFAYHSSAAAESRVFSNDFAGGGIMDVGCYPVSLARLVAGATRGDAFADPTEVSGAAHLGETGVDEWAAGVLKFPGGVVAQVATGIAVEQENVARIFGSEGSILLREPWTHGRKGGGTFTLELTRGGKTEPVTLETDRTAYAYEADVVGRAIAAGRQQPEPPAMTWADTLGNMLTLDRWRAAVGLTYDMEQPERQTTPVHGRPLRRPERSAIPQTKIEGLSLPVSRAVMGVDNQPTPSHASVMFDAYYELGGNAFDTAWIYGGGKQERLLGGWMTQRGVRDELVLIGKGAHTPHCHPEGVTKQLHESLDRLQTDRLDIYMLHRDNPDVPVGEFVDVLNEHAQAGRMTLFGGSNWSTQRIEAANAYAAARGLQGFSVLSNNFSLARMVEPVWPGCIAASTPDFRAWLEKTQMPLFAWSSQARGFFTGRADLPADEQPDKSLVASWYSDDNFQRRSRAIELAKKKGVQPINIALAYVLSQPFPSFALIGPRTLAELRTSLPGLTVELTPDEVRWLNLEG